MDFGECMYHLYMSVLAVSKILLRRRGSKNCKCKHAASRSRQQPQGLPGSAGALKIDFVEKKDFFAPRTVLRPRLSDLRPTNPQARGMAPFLGVDAPPAQVLIFFGGSPTEYWRTPNHFSRPVRPSAPEVTITVPRRDLFNLEQQ